MTRKTFLYWLIGIVVIVVASVTFSPLALAQDGGDSGTLVVFTGPVDTIEETTIFVSGFPVDISDVTVSVDDLQIGVTVTVTGNFDGKIVVATSIVVDAPEATPEPSPEDAAGSGEDIILTIEGPITNINIETNIVTIFDFDIHVDPLDPILRLVDIGDPLRIVGTFDPDGHLMATTVSNIVSTVTTNIDTSVGLDGPVEAINGNVVTVNGIQAQFNPGDPVLQTLQLGDFLNVQGNFQTVNDTVVLIVVNVTVITNVVVGVSPCWFHAMGMGMGHWHCDGLGMGMGYASCYYGVDGMGRTRWYCDDGMGMGMAMGLSSEAVCVQRPEGLWWCFDAMGMGR